MDAIFKAAAMAANQARIPLAKEAVAETGMGVVEDKVIKNHYASEYIYNTYKNVKTCGVVEEDPAFGVKKLLEPVGVIGAVIPTTNPTSTAIFKVLLALKTRNGIIISPHPRAKGCTVSAARLVLEAAVAARRAGGHRGMDRRAQPGAHRPADGGGGPDPGHRRTRHGEGGLFFRQARRGRGRWQRPRHHRQLLRCALAVSSVIHSKTFDNGMVCASEQSVIVLDPIYDQVKAEFAARGCYFLKGEETDRVRKTILIDGSLNNQIVGQSAHRIGELARHSDA